MCPRKYVSVYTLEQFYSTQKIQGKFKITISLRPFEKSQSQPHDLNHLCYILLRTLQVLKCSCSVNTMNIEVKAKKLTITPAVTSYVVTGSEAVDRWVAVPLLDHYKHNTGDDRPIRLWYVCEAGIRQVRQAPRTPSPTTMVLDIPAPKEFQVSEDSSGVAQPDPGLTFGGLCMWAPEMSGAS